MKRRYAFWIMTFLLLVLTACIPLEATTTPASNATPSDHTGLLPSPSASAPSSVPSPSVPSSPVISPSPLESPVPQGPPYYLYLEKGSYTLTIYTQDDKGDYSIVYKTYRVSHGNHKTPSGTFKLSKSRERWHEFRLGGFVQYATSYYEGWLFIHSPLYGAEDTNRLWPLYYDGDKGIGGANTDGCIRMVTEAAKFIYENCPEGTEITIVNGDPLHTTSENIPNRNGKTRDPTDKEAF